MNTLEEGLGFDKIKELVAGECTNALAVRMAGEMLMMTDHGQIVHELQLCGEMRELTLMSNGFPNGDFEDISAELEGIRVAGTIIPPEQLPHLCDALHTMADCVGWLTGAEGEQYPALRALAAEVSVDPMVMKRIDDIVDEKGEVRDGASEELRRIRRDMVRKRGEMETQIERTLNHAKQEGWAPAGAEPTIRNGRQVIPMLDTHRRKIKGLIHDESATRQTAYVEPAEVVELGNDLRELEFEERREIVRILLRLCDMLRPMLDDLLDACSHFARLDFLRAKARLAVRIDATIPKVEDRPALEWYMARHPLLHLACRDAAAQALKEAGPTAQRSVVPFNIELGGQRRILIVSGPNAGGKSVCLKAVGLIQYMLQCGLPVPVKDSSVFGIFHSIFIDIGDQQSMEDDLSTYTSHLRNMTTLLEEADERTLFLLDELGGGTEPRSGCAIAEALLEELHSRGSIGMATTHFADLKLLADRLEGVANGAMLFDTERMRPLYRLAIGRPGSSFAFEIARNVGFPDTILRAAEGKIGAQMLNFEHQLQQLDNEKQELARQRQELEQSDEFLNEVITKYQRLAGDMETRRHDIISQARAEARKILEGANRSVEQTISDIKKAQAEKERTREARQRLEQSVADFDEQTSHEEQRHRDTLKKLRKGDAASGAAGGAAPAGGPIAVGDAVIVDGEGTAVRVVELKGKKAVVESRSMRMTIALERLSKSAKLPIGDEPARASLSRHGSIYDDINQKRLDFNPTLDLRGMRADEAMEALDTFLDNAILLSEHEVRILHGKGFGILLTVTRQRLKANRRVESFHPERVELGGEGITVVHLI
ncbi:MAG: Smr/MutS family protein [Bacteroidales bacterium]|nr:Smr/MutS family protein [Bacteroidales bacterium]